MEATEKQGQGSSPHVLPSQIVRRQELPLKSPAPEYCIRGVARLVGAGPVFTFLIPPRFQA
jgi:hypothetical protein